MPNVTCIGPHAGGLRRTLLIGVLTVVLALGLATGALAAGKVVNVGTPFSSGPPSTAVDSSGNVFIAWANTKDLAGADNFVQYCVLPVGATACAHSGNLIPADAAKFIDGVHVLSVGGTLVVLADVFGTAGSNAADYVPVQEWQSTDGGVSFNIVNGGLSVTSGNLNADTGPLSAVIVPGTGVLGFGWDTAGASPPTFNAFPLASPPECSRASCPQGFAALEPGTNPDQLGNEPGQFASQFGPNAGVMGVFDTLFTNGPLGCAKSFGTAYVYGSGSQSPTNNYNVSPGSTDSAWKLALSQADCDTEYAVVGGGPSGFGILEANLGTATTQYHRFNPATQRFDTSLVTIANKGEQQGALSQDGAGGVYATYLLGGAGGPIALSYSADGGRTWTSGTLNANKSGGADKVTSAMSGSGQGWAAWTDNGSMFAQPFQASDAISPASVGGGATSNGQTVTLSVSCGSFPCTVTITLTAPETVVIHAASVAAKRKTLKLGSGKITIRSKGRKKLTIKLTARAKRLLKSKKKAHFKVTAAISETIAHHRLVSTRTLKVTL